MKNFSRILILLLLGLVFSCKPGKNVKNEQNSSNIPPKINLTENTSTNSVAPNQDNNTTNTNDFKSLQNKDSGKTVFTPVIPVQKNIFPNKPDPNKTNTSIPSVIQPFNAMAISKPYVFITPEDIKLGPLPFSNDPLVIEADKQARLFLDGLIVGKIRKDTIIPELSSVMEIFLSDSLKKASKIISYRLAAMIPLPGDSFSANMRIYSASGFSEGEIIIQNSKNQMYVSAFFMDFLNPVSYPEKPVVFEPSVYNSFFP